MIDRCRRRSVTRQKYPSIATPCARRGSPNGRSAPVARYCECRRESIAPGYAPVESASCRDAREAMGALRRSSSPELQRAYPVTRRGPSRAGQPLTSLRAQPLAPCAPARARTRHPLSKRGQQHTAAAIRHAKGPTPRVCVHERCRPLLQERADPRPAPGRRLTSAAGGCRRRCRCPARRRRRHGARGRRCRRP